MENIILRKITDNIYISSITEFIDKYILIDFKSSILTYMQSVSINEGIYLKFGNDTIGYINVSNNRIGSIVLFLGESSLFSNHLTSELLMKKFENKLVMR